MAGRGDVFEEELAVADQPRLRPLIDEEQVADIFVRINSVEVR